MPMSKSDDGYEDGDIGAERLGGSAIHAKMPKSSKATTVSHLAHPDVQKRRPFRLGRGLQAFRP